MEEYLRDPSGDNLLGLGGAKAELVAASMGVSDTLTHTHTIDCTRKWIGNAAYIVYVTSLAILRTVTARRKLAGVTNDKESVLLIAVREPCLSG